ncbi:MAG: phosphoglycerate mutase family protein [bacterium]|nr:phosphoglycerate mutase family protein [bacterium]
MSEFNEEAPSKEREKQRIINVYFVRHAEASYKGRDDKDGTLTESGKIQAEQAGRQMFEQISDGVIKFYSSPLGRSQETAQIIRQVVEDEILKSGKDVKVLSGSIRDKQNLVSIDILTDEYWQLRRAGVRDPVQHWLSHSQESPQEALKVFEDLVEHFKKLSSRLSPNGPNLHLVCVTHGGNPELFLKKVTGLEHLPDLDNCEVIKLNFAQTPESKTKVVYRGNEYTV